MCMKTGEELYCEVYLPRVTLTSNPQHSRKDPPNLDARQSDNCEIERRTCSGNIHTPLIDQVDTNRRETVKRLIEQFEKKNFEKAKKINNFSEESKN